MLKLDSNYLESSIEDGEFQISLIPCEELVEIVKRKQPRVLYDKLPSALRERVVENRSIPLDMDKVEMVRGDFYLIEETNA